MIEPRPARVALRVLWLAQLREQPLRLVVTVLAIALGVALGVAVYLINTAALSEFDQATRRLVGAPDVVIRGPAAGFDESLFTRLAREPTVALASPVLELQLALAPAEHSALKLLALDPFRAGALQPELIGALSADIDALFAHDAIVLSRAAADELGLERSGRLSINVGGNVTSLRVIDILPANIFPEPLGIMDIAAAQWTLERLGTINRIDLQLRPDIDRPLALEQLRAQLPAGVFAVSPQIERSRADNATRAYRVNLDVLAFVALLTGAFVVFSTQWLSVLRRRVAFGLLRSLGITRGELQLALLSETAASGALGSLLGVLLGAVIAALMLRYLGADLGNGQLAADGAQLGVHARALLGFALLGSGAACAGGAIPAWQAAQRPPALALKAGDAEEDLKRLDTTKPGLVLLVLGALLVWLPAVAGLPLAGYLSIAALLLGSVLLVPLVAQRLIALLPRSGHAVPDTALAQLQGSLGSATVSLAAIIVSFSLMVAMAIMVHSFRDSFEVWLVKLLPADMQLRGTIASDTSRLSVLVQNRIASLAGVARIEVRHVQPILLEPDRPPVALIARELSAARAADTLPLQRAARELAGQNLPPAWISEAVQDRYGYRAGQQLSLPLKGRTRDFFIAGVWRDYVHPGGAIVIRREDYIAATSDESATEISIWRAPHTDAAVLAAAIRAALGPGEAFDLISSDEIRERSLRAFDRTFLVTYALEAIAVLVGLLGISVAASSTALARRAQFGMLRHLGMLRRQVLWMFASEGLALSGIAVLYGLVLGALLSLILVYVINRQSFNWSINLVIPWTQLASLSLLLIAASALTSLWSGRAAMSLDSIRAVREDW
jgi:putative ABC transport system permease protein